MSRPTEDPRVAGAATEAVADGASAIYENSDIFLRHRQEQEIDPFDAEFERSLRDAPAVAVRPAPFSRQSSASSGSVAGNTTPSKSSLGSCGSTRSSKKSSYDEMSINAGRPVILGGLQEGEDSLTSVTFGSPYQDVQKATRPVPAPRLSVLRSNCERDEQLATDSGDVNSDDAAIYEELIPKQSLDRHSDLSALVSPDVPPRNKSVSAVIEEIGELETKLDNLYCELDSHSETGPTQSRNYLDDNDNEEEREDTVEELTTERRSLLNSRITTIDIRQDVNKLWEKAVQELDLDESLVEYLEKHESASEESKKSEAKRSVRSRHSYDSVAVPESRFKIVNGVQVPIPITLLKNFDPYFDTFDEPDNDEESSCSSSSSSGSSAAAIAISALRAAPVPATVSATRADSLKRVSSARPDGEIRVKENIYETRPRASDSNTSSCSSADLPPPTAPPPPAPPRSYENVWIPGAAAGGGGRPQLSDFATYAKATPPSKPKRSLSRKHPLETSYSEDGACALPLPVVSPASRLDRGVAVPYLEKDHCCGNDAVSEAVVFPPFPGLGSPPMQLRQVQRSSSASNLAFIAKKFSFSKFGRKISDQVMKPSTFAKDGFAEESSTVEEPCSSTYSSSPHPRRSSASLSETSWPGTVNHSGPLFVLSKGKKVQVQEKWCVLGHGNLRYFNRKDSLAEPKELILLRDILSLNKRSLDGPSSPGSETCETLHCFDVAFISSQEKRTKLSVRTFGTLTSNVRDGWVEKLSQSLSYKLSLFPLEGCSKLGWVYLKAMFAGEWHLSWVSVQDRMIYYTVKDDEVPERVDLKKAKNLTLVRDVKNLNAPDTSVPVLVVDFVDRSLYMQSRHEGESKHWKDVLEEIAFNNGGALGDQQRTSTEVPVIVEHCIAFVFRHGCLSEGIYRHSGVKTKIDRLLSEFRRNAWAVALTREDFSEHDVANCLKRFMRTLTEPLLTSRLRQSWMAASKLPDERERMSRYAQLLAGLPDINAKTLRRLVGHLRAIASQCDRNLMPNYNLAAIWGPTLLTVDGQEATDFAQTTGEADVCRDLIDNYKTLFRVTPEEMEREEEIMKKTENFNRNPNPIKISGEVMMFVHIDSKSSGEVVSLCVTPKMTAGELQRRVLRKSKYQGDSSKLILHEVILAGEMERPIHYNEQIYEVTLKWWQWSEEDRRDTYLLLKRNSFFEEAVPCSIPPLSVFGEIMYGENARASKGHFKKYHFSMNNAKITRSKEQKNGAALELDSWDIEKIIWFFGCEAKRGPPYSLNITWIEKESPVERTKEKPYFGRTISFCNRELFIKWVAGMLCAEHQSDIIPAETLLNIDDD